MSVATELTRIQTAKADIKASIEAKGVTVPSDALIDEYADYVDEISGGGGGQAEEDLKNLIERDITSITIPNGVTSIGLGAFNGCGGLTSVTIPNSVTSIGYQAFNGCRSLPKENNVYYSSDYKYAVLAESYQSSYQIKDGTRVLADYLFSTGSITSITIPDSVISIPLGLFYNRTTLTSVTIGSGVTSIGESAFYACTGLTSIIIPNTVTSIGESAFYACTGLTSIIIPNTVTSIENSAFVSCRNITSVTIGSGVKSIGVSAFQNCIGLTSVTIPNSVTTIGNNIFQNCIGLTSITIGNGVTTIGSNAFNGCTSLTSVTVQATTPPTLVHMNAFSNTNDCPIYVPAESVDTYKAANNWSSYASRIQAIPE